MTDAPICVTFENPAGSLFLEPAGYVRLIWSQTTNSYFVRNLLNQALDLLIDCNCNRILIDHSQTTPYGEKDCVWLLTDWFPRYMYRTQYGYAALVDSYNVFARLAVSSFGQQVRQRYGVHYHYFEADQQDDAVAWLMAQPANQPGCAKAYVATRLLERLLGAKPKS